MSGAPKARSKSRRVAASARPADARSCAVREDAAGVAAATGAAGVESEGAAVAQAPSSRNVAETKANRMAQPCRGIRPAAMLATGGSQGFKAA